MTKNIIIGVLTVLLIVGGFIFWRLSNKKEKTISIYEWLYQESCREIDSIQVLVDSISRENEELRIISKYSKDRLKETSNKTDKLLANRPKEVILQIPPEERIRLLKQKLKK